MASHVRARSAPLPVLNAYVDGDDEIVIVEQLDDGFRERRQRAEYTTYHNRKKLERNAEIFRKLKNSKYVTAVVPDGDWIRVSWTNNHIRKKGRYWLREHGIESYEGDVDPVVWWMTEQKIQIARPRRCYIDIETDSRVPFSKKEEARILSWAITDDAGRDVVDVLAEDDDESERALVERLWKELASYDQVLAWNGDDFDFPVIFARTAKLGLGVDERRWLWLDQLVTWRRMNQHPAESGAEKESMRLEDIAQSQIGEGKERVPDFVVERFGSGKHLGALTWELWEAGGEFRELLVKYNLKDTVLLRKLEVEKGYITLFQTLCEACTVLGQTDGLNPTRQLDGFLLRLGREKNYRFPTKRYTDGDENEKFRGAYVMAPRTVGDDSKDSEWTTAQAASWREAQGMKDGILYDVHVCDFAGLYPNIILTWNLSEDTRAGFQPDPGPVEPGKTRSPGTGLLTIADRHGILTIALREMIRLRKHWADLAATLPPGTPEWQNAMAKSTAYKVAANSFYGVVGSPFSRYFDQTIAESTTQNGVWLLKLVIEHAMRRRMVVVYGDTDSAFVIGPSRDAFGAFVNWCNEKLFPKVTAELGCKENHIKLAFEKTFSRIVFTSAKRYCGRYSHYKGTPSDRFCHGLYRRFKKGEFLWRDHKKDKLAKTVAKGETCPTCGEIGKLAGKPEIKGIEYKRGDTALLARHLQGQIIDLLVGGVEVKDEDGNDVPINPDLETPTDDLEVYHAVLSKMRDHVLSDRLTREEVRLSKSLSRPLKEYVTKKKADGTPGAVPPHVLVARELQRRGHSVAERTRIEYVVVDGDASPMQVIPADDYANEFDRYYLWDTLVYPPTQRLLEAAFPNHDWASWGNTRPPKPKGRSKPLPGQLGLSLSNPSTRVDDLAVPTFSASTLVVLVPEEAGEAALKRVKKVLLEHPGARPAEIVIKLKSGAEAVLTIPYRVSTGPRLKEAVQRAIEGPTAAAS